LIRRSFSWRSATPPRQLRTRDEVLTDRGSPCLLGARDVRLVPERLQLEREPLLDLLVVLILETGERPKRRLLVVLRPLKRRLGVEQGFQLSLVPLESLGILGRDADQDVEA
jgi:hypothetical protein